MRHRVFIGGAGMCASPRRILECATAAIVACLLLAPRHAYGQIARGRVLADDGRPIAGALVEVGRISDSVRTNSAGEFELSRIGAGGYRARVRALGYREKYVDIRVDAISGWSGSIVMERLPQELPEVNVQALGKPAEFANTTMYDDFFRRKRLGQGTFRSRDDFIRMGVSDVAGSLQAIPGVSVTTTMTPFGETETRFRISRCPGQPPNLGVFINGVRQPLFFKRGDNHGSELSGLTAGNNRKTENTCQDCVRLAEVLSSIPFSDILFIEFYRGPGEIPSDVDRGNYCAALVIWTR
jgi:hypothetical protein